MRGQVIAHHPRSYEREDFVFDRHFLAEWQRFFPHAEAHTWSDCGHYLLEDATEEVIMRVREFLARHPIATRAHV